MRQISNLILEVTRKCNIKCMHCLRGDAQRVTMSVPVLHGVLQHLEYICTLTITGGEPSLAPEVLEEFLQICYWRKIRVGDFYIKSNGMNHNKYRRFLNAVERLYNWCDEQASCTLTVSRDQFHEFEPNKHLGKFEMRDEYGHHGGEFPPYFQAAEGKDSKIYRVLNEGRAAKTQVATEYEIEQQKPWELHSDGDYVIDPEVYVSANGNVVSACNMAFERIDRESKGNVLTTPFPQIIESYSTKQPEEVQEVAA